MSFHLLTPIFCGYLKQTPNVQHMISDKPHSCDLCNKKFALACNLRAHVKTHEGDPQATCTRCGKLFLCRPTERGLCPRCRNPNNNCVLMNSAAEESSGNQTEDSTNLY